LESMKDTRMIDYPGPEYGLLWLADTAFDYHSLTMSVDRLVEEDEAYFQIVFTAPSDMLWEMQANGLAQSLGELVGTEMTVIFQPKALVSANEYGEYGLCFDVQEDTLAELPDGRIQITVNSTNLPEVYTQEAIIFHQKSAESTPLNELLDWPL